MLKGTTKQIRQYMEHNRCGIIQAREAVGRKNIKKAIRDLECSSELREILHALAGE